VALSPWSCPDVSAFSCVLVERGRLRLVQRVELRLRQRLDLAGRQRADLRGQRLHLTGAQPANRVGGDGGDLGVVSAATWRFESARISAEVKPETSVVGVTMGGPL
jgi:hypothetical protein